MSPLIAFAVLLVGHALMDGPTFQPAALSRAKRPRYNPHWWPAALALHAGLHGLWVWAALGLWWLGLAEFTLHALIDRAKGLGFIGTGTDQTLHVACKVAWVCLYVISFH